MAARKKRIEKSAKAFRSIGEVAKELGLETHVLRYWEGKFPRDVRPVKRADGRRMFRPQDIDALRAIQTLVHERGLTLKGAKALLAEQSVAAVLSGKALLVGDVSEAAPIASPARDLQGQVARAFDTKLPPVSNPERRARLTGALSEMTDLKARLDAVRARAA